jgi:hypothetical protein
MERGASRGVQGESLKGMLDLMPGLLNRRPKRKKAGSQPCSPASLDVDSSPQTPLGSTKGAGKGQGTPGEELGGKLVGACATEETIDLGEGMQAQRRAAGQRAGWKGHDGTATCKLDEAKSGQAQQGRQLWQRPAGQHVPGSCKEAIQTGRQSDQHAAGKQVLGSCKEASHPGRQFKHHTAGLQMPASCQEASQTGKRGRQSPDKPPAPGHSSTEGLKPERGHHDPMDQLRPRRDGKPSFKVSESLLPPCSHVKTAGAQEGQLMTPKGAGGGPLEVVSHQGGEPQQAQCPPLQGGKHGFRRHAEPQRGTVGTAGDDDSELLAPGEGESEHAEYALLGKAQQGSLHHAEAQHAQRGAVGGAGLQHATLLSARQAGEAKRAKRVLPEEAEDGSLQHANPQGAQHNTAEGAVSQPVGLNALPGGEPERAKRALMQGAEHDSLQDAERRHAESDLADPSQSQHAVSALVNPSRSEHAESVVMDISRSQRTRKPSFKVAASRLAERGQTKGAGAQRAQHGLDSGAKLSQPRTSTGHEGPVQRCAQRDVLGQEQRQQGPVSEEACQAQRDVLQQGQGQEGRVSGVACPAQHDVGQQGEAQQGPVSEDAPQAQDVDPAVTDPPSRGMRQTCDALTKLIVLFGCILGLGGGLQCEYASGQPLRAGTLVDKSNIDHCFYGWHDDRC